MNIFTIDGIDYLHIQDFAHVINRSKQSTRHLIEDGNSMRRLKAFRDRSRLMIPVAELIGYPFVNQGKQLTGQDVYHYTPYVDDKPILATDAIKLGLDRVEWRRELCSECTYDHGCVARGVADGLIVPRGDA